MRARLQLLGVGVFLCLVIGVSVLLAGYRPRKAFNDHAVKTSCTLSHVVLETLCTRHGVTSTCFKAYLATEARDAGCAKYDSVGTFASEEAAKQWLSRWPPTTFPCYITPSNPCNPQTNLSDTHTVLITGTVFMGLACVQVILMAIMVIRRMNKRRELI